MLVSGLALGATGLIGFGVAVTFASDGTLSHGPAVAAVLLFRGVLVGAGLAVLPVAALAVAGTSAEDRRTGAVGLFGAASDVGSALGPLAGGALAAVSLAMPLYVAPVVVVVVAAVLLVVLQPGPSGDLPARIRPAEALPAFGVGFLLHLAFVLAQVTIIVVMSERLGPAAGTAGVAAVVAAVTTVGLVGTQGVLVPLLKPPPGLLMKIGAPVALAGYVLLAVAPSLLVAAAGSLVAAVGTGLGGTGFAATATFAAGTRRQGLVAGLVCGTVGLTAVVAPALGELLRLVDPLVAVGAAGVAALLATGLALVPAGGARPNVPA
ncbi:Major Facilitator Superfamily protein [Lentzea fradiae]|uniref:Major Facilitator Superfamily protein n=1 Tax=Lentzea fradiae TaxID=200378 RepID=A0A1G7P788_9PSEU|nr:Major Facilitator Superfamily protein [Lentzea fradiae]